ncbi:MAG: pyridoxal phosphate-dependent aminotransferase [Acidobacteria bacterium]|nr:pyridoxal phosphate-dependent aminotransferase [Acidobacteriota bacterium]MCI0621187.1 pyridoxal phosphate-dependent aminotransferase [Acidobacteriota bacterium]MCI0719802.1 pyridoxal phosphate-dependent aminotransferase [Acidobacteriota bacterium]
MPQSQLASSVLQVPRSRIRELANIAFKMDGVLKLYFGESNLPTPQYIKDAAARALQEGFTFYTHNAGLPSLRQAIAEKYSELHNVKLNPESEIVVTASGVQALNVAIRCVLDPGDEALLLTPAWPNASAIVRLCSALPREIPLVLHGTRYRIDFEALQASLNSRTRLLVYTSPSNPLGWVATEAEQEQLLSFCRRHELWLLADEVYERLYYRGSVAPSIFRKCHRDDAVIVAHSFSKSYCMTGWRLGWVASRQDLAQKATEMNEFIISHAPAMVQKAGEAALREGESEISAMVGRLKDNLTFCQSALTSMPGVVLPEPEGAFYLFPKIEGLTDSFDFCKRLLWETRVGLAPGVAFGNGGEGSVRICYAADRSVLEPAMERLAIFLERGCEDLAETAKRGLGETAKR